MSFSLEQIDNAVYNLLRLKAIEFRCLPDARNYDTFQTYNTAKLNLQAEGNIIVEVYPVNAKQERDSLQQATITVDRQTEITSDLGGKYTVDGEAFEGQVPTMEVPNTTYDVTYTATFFSQNKVAADMAERICMEAWKHNTTVPGRNDDYTETDEKLLFIKEQTIDMSDGDYIEKQVNITVKYVYLNALVYSTLPAMQNLTFIPKTN